MCCFFRSTSGNRCFHKGTFVADEIFFVSLLTASLFLINDPDAAWFPVLFAFVGVRVGTDDVEVLLLVLASALVAVSSLALPPRSVHAMETPETTLADNLDPSSRGKLTPNGASPAEAPQLLLVVRGDDDAPPATTTVTATRQ